MSFDLKKHKNSNSEGGSAFEHETIIKNIIEKFERNTYEKIGPRPSSNMKNNLEKLWKKKLLQKTYMI